MITYTMLGNVKGNSISFAKDSWKTISKISASGLASSYYNIGDEKIISINGTDYTIQIIGFNHDSLAGGGKSRNHYSI